MDPLQAMVNGLNAAAQHARSESGQMTLGALIAALEALPKDRRIVGCSDPMSYRGYYCDLAFEPDSETTVAEALKAARRCMGRAFTGYKGGEFQMGERTPIWSSSYGMCGPKIVGLDTASDPIRPVTEEGE